MVAIEHRQKPTTTTATTTPTPTTTPITTPTSSNPEDLEQQQQQEQEQEQQLQEHQHEPEADQAPEPPQQPGSDEPGEEEEQAEEVEVEAVIKTTTNTSKNKMSKNELESAELAKRHREAAAAAIAKSAVSQRGVELKIGTGRQAAALDQELAKKVLKLDLTGPELDEYALKSPKSPISARLPHQTSLTSSVDVEDRKTLREALYQGIFHRHRRTIFAVGSFLRMLRSRNSQYNTIRSSSEGEDMDEAR